MEAYPSKPGGGDMCLIREPLRQKGARWGWGGFVSMAGRVACTSLGTVGAAVAGMVETVVGGGDGVARHRWRATGFYGGSTRWYWIGGGVSWKCELALKHRAHFSFPRWGGSGGISTLDSGAGLGMRGGDSFTLGLAGAEAPSVWDLKSNTILAIEAL
ncbi:hypothetical protein CYMTET_36254 [Cymbomonas tetramitiformis]|uniref:Uncharacterized protein n=1 Tax=Cymbomonas tetramitiformis TaxID=36881 RepID=A0AAE0CGB4_9CHLO|nr:hypothetical protein CYMTET_36254 [Cymbomonas tetramitiformis]